MPKLFTAIDLPDPVKTALARLQPAPAAGVRIVKPDQMHVTLHFFGDIDLDRIVALLQTVRVPSFDLALRGVGQFPSAQNSTTLWAGVEVGAGLRTLHDAIGAAIVAGGLPKEARSYNPHITLARCEAGTSSSLSTDFHGASFRVSSFELYSSTMVDGVPHYRREREFLLTPV